MTRSDLNFDAAASPVASNRLIVEADGDGEICFYTLRPAALIVDVNGVSDNGIHSFRNARTDTRCDRPTYRPRWCGACSGATGERRQDRDRTAHRGRGRKVAGFVTAYACADGMPTDAAGAATRSDLNYDGRVSPVASNRLVVEADANGDVCFYTLSRRGDCRRRQRHLGYRNHVVPEPAHRHTHAEHVAGTGTETVDGVPVWPPYDPLPALDGVAALTGLAADATVAQRPVLAVKIDNYGAARPQWGLDQADAVLEVNVEGVSRFIALFHSDLPPKLGPVRSARTGDLDLLTAMNRPVFAFSGANPGVTQWIASAAGSGVLVDFSAQHSPCYSRSPDRAGPHNLLLDPVCALAAATDAGPARPLWSIDSAWAPSSSMHVGTDTTFTVPMDGVRVEWTWDAGPHIPPVAGRPTARRCVGRAHHGCQCRRARNELRPVAGRRAIAERDHDRFRHRRGASRRHRNPGDVVTRHSVRRFEFHDAASNQPIPLDTGTTFLEFERG